MCAAFIAYKRYGIFLTTHKPAHFWQVNVNHHNCHSIIDIAMGAYKSPSRDIGGAWMKGNIMSWCDDDVKYNPATDWDSVRARHKEETDKLQERIDNLTELCKVLEKDRDAQKRARHDILEDIQLNS